MTEKNNGGPAFPGEEFSHFAVDPSTSKETPVFVPRAGMSLRAYAAIKLKQPDSGIDWLDEMILKSKRDEAAAKAMQGIYGGRNPDTGYFDISIEKVVGYSYEIADAMLKAGEE